MMRPVVFAIAAIALAVPAPAAAPDLSGNWVLSTIGPVGESAVCILKVETKDGKPTASVVFAPENAEVSISHLSISDKSVALTLKQTRTFKTTQGDRKITTELPFVGVIGKDGKIILGSTGDHRNRSRAKLAATDKTTLAKEDLVVRSTMPEPMTKAQQLNTKVLQAQNRWQLEKDAAKKKDLLAAFLEVRKEADEKLPALYREVVEKHAGNPAALDAALVVLRSAARVRLTPEVASMMVKLIQEKGSAYGPLFVAVALAGPAETMAGQAGLEAVAVAAIEGPAKALPEDAPVALQAEVLGAYKNALTKAGKLAEAKALATRLDRLEGAIDAEYLKTVPPFKPAAFAGRKDRNANQVAVMELFTGAQCPPCVAADVGFDALLKAYKPTDLVLIQYHMHIPGPDALTNPDTVARWDYYRKEFPQGIRGTPSTLFNGKPQAGGGGGMAASENKFNQYAEIINPLLEKSTEVKLAGRATRAGDKVNIAVEATNADAENLKLRVLVVEESVKYIGSNGLRFHHNVVRAMPGGADGIVVKDKSYKHTATVDLAEIRKNLSKYLDDYAANTRPFAKPDRPMEMKDLRVIALVQNDKTKEIVQAVQFDVEGKAVGGGGE